MDNFTSKRWSLNLLFDVKYYQDMGKWGTMRWFSYGEDADDNDENLFAWGPPYSLEQPTFCRVSSLNKNIL